MSLVISVKDKTRTTLTELENQTLPIEITVASGATGEIVIANKGGNVTDDHYSLNTILFDKINTAMTVTVLEAIDGTNFIKLIPEEDRTSVDEAIAFKANNHVLVERVTKNKTKITMAQSTGSDVTTKVTFTLRRNQYAKE